MARWLPFEGWCDGAAVIASTTATSPFSLLVAIVRAWLRPAEPAGLLLNVSDLPAAELAALIQVAGRHRVTPTLAAALEAQGHLAGLPADFARILRAARSYNLKRNAAFSTALEETCLLLNGIGIEPVLLKGANRLVDDLYPDTSYRFLNDLDLLIPDDKAAEAHALLCGSGYRAPFASEPPHHLPLLEHPVLPVAIELHHQPLPPPADRVLSAAMVARTTTRHAFGAAQVQLPSPFDQIVHLVAAAQIQDSHRWTGTPPLRELWEAALLLERLGPDGVQTVIEWFRQAGFGLSARVFFARLAATLGLGAAPPVWGGPAPAVITYWARLQDRSAMARAIGRMQRLCGRYALDLQWFATVPQYRVRLIADLGTKRFYCRRIASLARTWR